MAAAQRNHNTAGLVEYTQWVTRRARGECVQCGEVSPEPDSELCEDCRDEFT